MNGSGDRKPRFIWAVTLLVVAAACIECPCDYARGGDTAPICLGGCDLSHAHSTSFCCELCEGKENTHAVTKKKVDWRRISVALQGRFGQLPVHRANTRLAVSPNLKCLTAPDLDDLQTRLE